MSDQPTCARCGKSMMFNVPRMGPAGGFVHADTGLLGCAMVDLLLYLDRLEAEVKEASELLAKVSIEFRHDGKGHCLICSASAPHREDIKHFDWCPLSKLAKHTNQLTKSGILVHHAGHPITSEAVDECERRPTRPCRLCGIMTTDWVDPDWAKGRVCRECEAIHDPDKKPPATPVDDVQKRIEATKEMLEANKHVGSFLILRTNLQALLTRIEELEKEVSKRLSPEASKNIVVELGERNKTIEELSAKLAEAEKDKERVDKIDALGRDFGSNKGSSSIKPCRVWTVTKSGHGGDLRSTLDAMSASKPV